MKKLLIISSTIIGSLIVLWLVVSTVVLFLVPGSLFENKVSWTSIPNYGYEKEYLPLESGEKISFFRFENEANQGKPVILYLHGNTGRIVSVIDGLKEDYNVYSPSYPGYSDSEGNPSPETVLETAEVTFKYLTNDLGIDQENIIIFGHSMGGSPATYLASKNPKARKLVLANTFSSVQSMCFRDFNIFCAFTGGILNSAEYAQEVEIPVSHFAYKGDTAVPFEEGEKLNTYFKKSPENKFIELNNFTHTDLDLDEIKKELN